MPKARIARTMFWHWMLLGCTGIVTVCTLTSEFCVEFMSAKLMCQFKNTCNNGICIVNITSTNCNITCNCTGGYQGTFCELPPTDHVTTQSSHHGKASDTNTTTNCALATLTSTLTVCAQYGRCGPGNCSIDTKECSVACDCPPGYDGKYCENNTNDVTSVATTTDHVTESKKCGNEYTCDHGYCPWGHFPCICYHGWDGPLCNVPCNLTCAVGGVCKIIEGRPFCNCLDTRRTGSSCELLRTTIGPEILNRTVIQREEADYRYIAGVVVGAVVFVLVITSILCLILWKRRAIIILKLIHWFKPYEDDDYKLYDAFISYKSSHSNGSHSSSPEELFVIHTLMPKLEQELGFRLCVHFRDFLPGRHITENVLDAIENSRRTILLLSRNYIENSFWTRFEYEQAQVAAMERKQRIIPIILEDISDVKIRDNTLHHILASITYLTWPGVDGESKKLNKFWTQLTLSMPKLMPSESVASVSYKETDGSSYVEIEDTVVAKTIVSNGPYTAPVTELDEISINVSDGNCNSKKCTDLINTKEHMIDKKPNGVLPGYKRKEENLRAKADEYVEILEAGV